MRWRDAARELVWRADEMELVASPPVEADGVVAAMPVLGEAWWNDLRSSLAALAAFATERVGMPQAHLSRRIGEMFGDAVDTTVGEWATAHADLHWANLTAPECHHSPEIASQFRGSPVLDWVIHAHACLSRPRPSGRRADVTVSPEVVPFTEFIQRPTATTGRLASVRALRLRRGDAEDLVVMPAGRAEREGDVVDATARLPAFLLHRDDGPALVRAVLPDVFGLRRRPRRAPAQTGSSQEHRPCRICRTRQAWWRYALLRPRDAARAAPARPVPARLGADRAARRRRAQIRPRPAV